MITRLLLLDNHVVSIRYDQSSCGLSKGVEREDATIEVWINDCLAILDQVAQGDPVVLVASSQGGWISVHVAKVRKDQIKGMVFIGEVARRGVIESSV